MLSKYILDKNTSPECSKRCAFCCSYGHWQSRTYEETDHHTIIWHYECMNLVKDEIDEYWCKGSTTEEFDES